MAKLFCPQISLEDYQLFRKFMLPGEFPQTHDQWVARIEKSKREDAVKCLTYEGACDVEVEPDGSKSIAPTQAPSRHATLFMSSSANKLDLWGQHVARLADPLDKADHASARTTHHHRPFGR